ncbi:MAG: hypothetical protein ACOC3V_02775 [bacterium]
MKNYNQFINNNDDKLNEEFIKKFFSKMWDKLGKIVGNTPGGKEVEKIYNEYKKKLETEIKKIAGVDLQAASAKRESLLFNYESFLNEKQLGDVENDETDEDYTDKKDVKLTKSALLKKSKLLNQKLDMILKEATKKMDDVLKEKGGAEKNVKLKELIELKKDTLKMDFLNMQLSYVEKSGDKEMIKKAQTDRNNKNKEIEERFNKISKMGDKKVTDDSEEIFKVGNRYRYNDDGEIKTIEITGEGDKGGEIIGFYVDDKSRQLQDFKTNNIETDFEVKEGDKFSYYSKSKNNWISVEIINIDGENVEVKGKGKPFKINKNLLGPEIKD